MSSLTSFSSSTKHVDRSTTRSQSEHRNLSSLTSFSLPSSTLKHSDEGTQSKAKENAELNRIRQQIEVYSRKVGNERKRIQDLNEQIIQHETMALEQKRAVGGDETNKHKEYKIETEKKILVDRLNKALVALNTKISENKKLRMNIDERRQERCRYDEIYTNLEIEIQHQAESMSQVLEKGKKTLKARDKAISELDVTNKQLEEGRRELTIEQDELQKLEEQFRYEDERVKIECRASRPQTTSSQRTAAEENEEEEVESFDDEKALDDSLAKVFELTGTNDVEKVVEQLTQTEEIHFGLFSRINELEAEADENETKISDAEQELKRVKRHAINNASQRQRELNLMEEKRKKLEAKISHVELRYQEQLDTWNNVRSMILVCHDELGLLVPEDRVQVNNVTEGNVMQYLSAIENRVSEILTEINGDFEDTSWPSPLANTNDDMLSRKKLELPSADTAVGVEGYGSELDDDGERPFTMKELQDSLEN